MPGMGGCRLSKTPRRRGGSEGEQNPLLRALHVHKLAHRSL